MDYPSIVRSLADSLQLAQPPVAVCLADALPAGIIRHTGTVPAGCLFWQRAAEGPFATAPGDHDLCAIGVYTHNLESTAAGEADLRDALEVFAGLGYVREQDLPLIPVLQSRPRHVVYAPLAETPLPPDVVLLFVRADQVLILTEASQQVEGGVPPAMGRPACAVVPQAKNSGRAALSLGCCGARAYLDTLTGEMAIYAIPGDRLSAYADRIAALARANAVLSRFHQVRRQDVESGKHPTVKESLAAIQ